MEPSCKKSIKHVTYCAQCVYDPEDEKVLEGIKVVAKDANGKIVGQGKTNSKGLYIINLPQSVRNPRDYHIEFTYDGINYIATEVNKGNDETIDSDGYEINRTAFNEKFKTITKDTKVTLKNGQKVGLEYSHTNNGLYDVATLITKDRNVVREQYEMIATTSPTAYRVNTKNIDLGLVKKDVDLATVTELNSATVTINGKTTTYNYSDLQKLDLDGNGNPKLEPYKDINAQYNLYLYKNNSIDAEYLEQGETYINNLVNVYILLEICNNQTQDGACLGFCSLY